METMTRACAVAALLAMVAVAHGATWETEDGLAVTLDDATGAVTGVSVDGEELPLVSGEPGGLVFREFTRPAEHEAEQRLALDFEAEEPTWTSAVMADWDAEEVFARRVVGDAPGGEAFLRIGSGDDPGAGMATAERIPLAAGELCTISWTARAAQPGGTLILCLRLFGEDGEDLTARLPAPHGWAHTPYSNAHYHVGFSPTPDWSEHSYEYAVPIGVASALLSLRVFRGGALQADIDDLRVSVLPGGWGPEQSVRGPLSGDERLAQSAAVAGLRFDTAYRAHPDRLSAEVTVSPADARAAPRCLRLGWRLPVAAQGWRWAAGPGESTVIQPEARYQDAVGFAGHPTGRYPLASIAADRAALAMATSLDPPALQGFRCDARGLATTVDLALSPAAPDAHAHFSFVLYRHDPAWGFRAALERYYAIFPHLFERRTDRGGCWTLRLPDFDTPDLTDFGLAFYECGMPPADAAQFCREQSILTFRYIEPWGLRQSFPEAEAREQMPSYEERLDRVRSWAAERDTTERWRGAPRNVMARAVLNSLILGPEGRAVYFEDLYTTWSTWWQTNSDPDLPSPNRAGVCRDTLIDPALERADGIYVDSVSPTFASHEDHAREHLTAADLPLAFSPATGDPVVLSGMAHAEFLTWLRDYLHERDKLLMFNLHPHATRLYGHLADVTGCELVGFQDDVQAMQQRVYAYHRPVSNLLQWRSAVLVRVPAMTPQEMRRHFDNQLLYGFWPGISTAGGGTEPGYRNMQRYFRTPELMERDRPLFRRYIPVFDALNQAGWEPVPHATAEPQSVRIERYGRPGGELYLAVHNPTDEAVTAALHMEPQWWVPALGGPPGLRDAIAGEERSARSLPLAARSTIVLAVTRR